MHQPVSRVHALTMRLANWNWLLIGAVALGAILRAWGIDFGLPYTIAPDEPWHLSIALRIFQTGDLNPHWLNYPSLMFYLNALAYFPFYWIGNLMGALAAPADIPFPEIIAVGVGKSLLPAQFILGRGVSALFGVGALALVYQIAREASASRLAASVAALLLAVSPVNVQYSQLIRPDAFVVFFVLLSVLYARRILDAPRARNYAVAAIAVGLAVSSKYSVPLVVMPLIAAHFLHFGWRGFRRAEIYFAGIVSALAFVLTTPFALLEFSQFLRDAGFEITKQVGGGHAGSEGDAVAWYFSFLWSGEGAVFGLALLEAARQIWTRSKSGIVLLVFPVTYFIFISALTVRNDRTILPVTPFVYLFAALFVARADAWLAERFAARGRLVPLARAAAILVLTLLPLRDTIRANLALTRADNRDAARAWINANVPAGARLALEAYAPYVERSRYMVQGLDGMIDHPPKWYEQNGFEYLVFSYGAYGRFYENAARYPDQVQQYDEFFKRYPRVAEFTADGFPIRIHKVGTPELPTQRVAARFGLYGGWVELIGYDLRAPTWHAGETQRIGFHWRALAARREPLTLTARLLDRDGREVALARAPLFGDAYATGPWPESIARAGFDLRVPANAPSGSYRVQLEVDGDGVGRVPVLSYANQPVSDKIILGPFKIAGAPPTRQELAQARALNARFANLISLIGYTTDVNAAHAGGVMTVTLYWRADLKMEENYTVFVHFIDASGAMRAQVDAQPRGGSYPTSLWDRDEIVRDDYLLTLPANLAPGEYRVSLGWYQSPSLARLSVLDATGRLLDDHLILPDAVRVR